MEKTTLFNIASQFDIEGRILDASPLGRGLINDNYLIETEDSDGHTHRYVLQRINTDIFGDTDLLQNNLKEITGHIRNILAKRGEKDIERKVLTCVDTPHGTSTVECEGKTWRMTLYIADSVTLDQMTPDRAKATGRAFGDFHSMLMAGHAPALAETIANFHNMPFRIGQLKDAIATADKSRLEETREIIDHLLSREEEMTLAERLFEGGKLPKRICHCDTKLDNILFDKDGETLCVIDLDTTMPGFIMSDFGDFIRTAANTAREDEPDTAKIGLDLDIFRAFTDGYLQAASFLTDIERSTLPHGAQRLTYMQTVRFLTDYLNGDKYYKTSYPEHNLVRTKAQLALLKSIDSHIGDMNRYVDNNLSN